MGIVDRDADDLVDALRAQRVGHADEARHMLGRADAGKGTGQTEEDDLTPLQQVRPETVATPSDPFSKNVVSGNTEPISRGMMLFLRWLHPSSRHI